MAFKFVVLAAALAVANAGLLPAAAPVAYSAAPVAYSAAPAVSHVAYSSPVVAAAPAYTSQHSNILRSYGNLGQVSTYSKTIDTPFSSVRKADIRVSNPGLKVAAPVAAYAAPAYAAHSYAAPVAHTYAAPVAHTYAAPVAHAAPAVGVAYSAAPAVSHVTYTGLGVSYGW